MSGTSDLLQRLKSAGLSNERPAEADLLAVLDLPPADLPELIEAAFSVRKHHHGMAVKVHVLDNAKSGACPEDCSFCSQSAHYQTGVDTYRLKSADELVEDAWAAHRAGAWKFCMVTATRGPSEKDLDTICEAVQRIKAEVPITICTSLGFLDAEKATRLKEAGVDRYNHNLETSPENFSSVVTTHGFDHRLETVRVAKAAGMEACSGMIMGLGEDRSGRVGLALKLRDLGVESIPVNFLNSRPGTPLEHLETPSPWDCLKTLAMFRFALPDRDVRAAGGREICLKHLQSLALYVANSIFTNGYLTTGGQGENADMAMIRDLGFEAVQPVAIPG